MTNIVINDASVNAHNTVLIRDINIEFATAELTVILGPNGAGKTTLLRHALGLTRHYTGSVLIDGQPAHALHSRERALKLAYLPQSRPLAWPVTVKDTVSLGRFAHGATLGRLAEADEVAVQHALKACQLLELQHRRTDTLSGGELARVHCARAFAAEAPLLLADEPVAALDPKHQFLIMQMIRNHVNQGRGAVVILHDPALAARFADRLVWMVDGQIVAAGSVIDTLNEARLAEVYGVASRVEIHDQSVNVSICGALDFDTHRTG